MGSKRITSDSCQRTVLDCRRQRPLCPVLQGTPMGSSQW